MTSETPKRRRRPTAVEPLADAAILVALAKLEERLEALAHRARNIDMKVDGCATQRDVKAISDQLADCATTKDLAPVVARVEKLEANQGKVISAIVTAWIAGLGVVAVGVKTKIGLA